MPQLNFPIIRFTFNTPFHISTEKSDYGKGSSYLHSDSLTAAIYFAWARLGKEEWIPKDKSEKQIFTISSLFPYTVDNVTGNYIYFLPRPMIRLRNEETVPDTKLRKKLKKVKYVDVAIFNRMLGGNSIPAKDGYISNGFRSLYAIPANLIQSQVVPRAAVNRSGIGDTTIFYMERFYFAPQSGLYALVHYNSEEVEKQVKTAINFLSEEGLGTDRNIGNGKFTADFRESLTFDLPENPTACINLGLYCPSDEKQFKEMMFGENTSYDIARRGGWLSEPYNTWRKRSVYMFAEGSVFTLPKEHKPRNNKIILGKSTDVKPLAVSPQINHPIWRSGCSIFIPF